MSITQNFKNHAVLSIITIALFVLPACHKSNNSPTIIPPAEGMVTDYGYKPGTYWIFQDSLSGITDSAYVVSDTSYLIYESCVLMASTPKHQENVITIRVSDGNVNDTETWVLTLLDSNATISFTNNKNNAINNMGYRLFNYPLKTGKVSEPVSCVMTADSGYIIHMYNSYAPYGFNGYLNTASILETNVAAAGSSFQDWFYISQQAGFVKVVFNHPSATHAYSRVLNLMNFHLVR